MSTAAGLSSCMQRNPHFYFEPLTLEVENELFKLPQILFTQCKTFTDLFPDVLNGSGHVVLGDCTKKQFEAFLTAVLEPLYRMLPEDHPCSEPLPLDSLLSALELANKWGFDQLSEDLGSNVSAVKKISLGRQHKIVTWFQSGLEELVLSEADISLADAEELGAMFTVRVYHARAAYWRQTQEKERGPGRVVDASAIVEEVFAKELGELAEGSENPPPPAPSQTHSSVPGVRLQPMPTRNAPGPTSDDESDDEESTGVPFTRSSTQVLTTGLSDLGSSGGDAMKTVIWAVFGPNPSRTRSLPRLMVTVPKICQKQEGKCGEYVRCKACCSKYAKHYYSTGQIPRARTAPSQMLLEKTILQQSQPTTLRDLISFVAKQCNKREETCGPWQRCGKCCRKKLKEMLNRNEVW